MKKSILFTFVLAAGFVATFLTGCGDDTKSGCNEGNGRDTGAHTVFINELNTTALGLTPIQDTLDVVKSGTTYTIASKALGRSLTGKEDPANCNNILLDSVIFDLTDTLRIPTSTLPIPGGVVKIWGIRGGGSGTVTATGSTTRINIVAGKTNISEPIDLTNLNGLKLNLRGNFLNLP
jgi:hypothetical protein